MEYKDELLARATQQLIKLKSEQQEAQQSHAEFRLSAQQKAEVDKTLYRAIDAAKRDKQSREDLIHQLQWERSESFRLKHELQKAPKEIRALRIWAELGVETHMKDEQ